MAAYELRPMGVGDILDTTFRLYRSRFLTFVTIALCVYIPYSLAMAGLEIVKGNLFPDDKTGALQAEETTDLFGDENPAPAETSPNAGGGLKGLIYILLGVLGYFLFVVVVFPLCIGAIIQNISAAYLGEEQTAAQSYHRAKKRLMKMIVVQLAVSIISIIGYLLCIVPGIFFTLWYMLATIVAMLEDTSIGNSLSRSKELMQGNLRKGIGLGLVVMVLVSIIMFILLIGAAFIPWPHPALAELAYTLLTGLLLPLQTAPLVLLYYDLRIRKEGFDLERLAMAVGGGVQPEA